MIISSSSSSYSSYSFSSDSDKSFTGGLNPRNIPLLVRTGAGFFVTRGLKPPPNFALSDSSAKGLFFLNICLSLLAKRLGFVLKKLVIPAVAAASSGSGCSMTGLTKLLSYGFCSLNASKYGCFIIS